MQALSTQLSFYCISVVHVVFERNPTVSSFNLQFLEKGSKGITLISQKKKLYDGYLRGALMIFAVAKN